MMVLAGCVGKSNTATEQAAEQRVGVKVVTADTTLIDRVAEFTGNIEASVVNNIGPNQPVRIQRILVDVGAQVYKGQLLVRMDPTSYNQAAVQLANIQADYDRLKSVYDAGGVARQQLDQVETSLRVAREQVADLRRNIELRSPTAGVVTGRWFDAGDLYSMTPNASGAAGILTVMQINPLKVTMAVSEAYFPEVKKGMGVDIKVDVFAERSFTGNVSLIYPAIDPATRTFTIEVSIPNPKQELRPGMFCRATLIFGRKEGILIEDIAVQKQVGTAERFVYVVRDGRAERRTVSVGRQIGNRIDILSGVRPGEQVVVSGASRLSDGTAVEIVK